MQQSISKLNNLFKIKKLAIDVPQLFCFAAIKKAK